MVVGRAGREGRKVLRIGFSVPQPLTPSLWPPYLIFCNRVSSLNLELTALAWLFQELPFDPHLSHRSTLPCPILYQVL